jgi:WD40 repeat protein
VANRRIMTDWTETLTLEPGNDYEDLFFVGGALPARHPGYVRRPADAKLLKQLLAGHYVHLFAPARSGKTSLIASVSAELTENNCTVAVLDMAQIGARGGSADAGRWYYSIAYRLLRQLRIKFDLQSWWHDRSILSNRQRLFEFYVEVILRKTAGQLVIFIDEAECVAELPFSRQFLNSIRAAFNARGSDPEFQRLSFAIIGSSSPGSFDIDGEESPFTISHNIELDDFTRKEIDAFQDRLQVPPELAEQVLDRVYFWTAGQPYLVQKLARFLQREGVDEDVVDSVDYVVQRFFLGRAGLNSEPHLISVERELLAHDRERREILSLYGRVRKGEETLFDAESAPQRLLLESGLLVVTVSGELAPRNHIYESVFTAHWANTHLPMQWRGVAIAAASIAMMILVPILYTQFLPRPYVAQLSLATTDLEMASRAHRVLESFPGHGDTANRLYENYLESKAQVARSRADIEAVAAYANEFAGTNEFGERLQADYWGRVAQAAMQAQDRDAALMATLESMVKPTLLRRRVAASLAGDDYARLLASHRPRQGFDRVILSAAGTLSYFDGAEVTQLRSSGSALVEKSPWQITALEITPLVRRVIVEKQGAVSRIGLSVNVSHSRVDDLRLKLIAPSGRTLELDFNVSASSANDVVRFEPRELADLRGEPVRGTWSLSIRDEKPGVTGQLMAWDLSLNSEVQVEEFDRGMDIPDATPQPSDDVWTSADGRFAVARFSRSDYSRAWNLESAEALGLATVPLTERVIGVVDNGATLVTSAQDQIHLWNLSEGGAPDVLPAGKGSANAVLSGDGTKLLAVDITETGTIIGLWSLKDRKPLDSLEFAGRPALIALSAGGDRIAIADYDRSVRVGTLPGGQFLAQFDLEGQPSEMWFAANGMALAVVYCRDGYSMWHVNNPAFALLEEWGTDHWNVAFSPSGDRVVAGSARRGYRVYESATGAPLGPALEIGEGGATDSIQFSEDEMKLVSVSQSGLARAWDAQINRSLDASAKIGNEGRHLSVSPPWLPAAVAPGGKLLALTDVEGHVHFQRMDGEANVLPARDDLGFLGHRGIINKVAFNADGKLLASAGRDGFVRIWDVGSGQPRPYLAEPPAGDIVGMSFSPGGNRLAAITGSRLWIMDVASGETLAELEIGDALADIVFAEEGRAYAGGRSGTLYAVAEDRSATWRISPVWQGDSAIRGLRFAYRGHHIAVADAGNRIHMLHAEDGSKGELIAQFPEEIIDFRFTPAETSIVVQTHRWLHRATVTPDGFVPSGSVLTIGGLPGSGIAFESPGAATDAAAQAATAENSGGDRVILLKRGSGIPAVKEITFSFSQGPTLIGEPGDLLNTWRTKLDAPAGIDEDR